MWQPISKKTEGKTIYMFAVLCYVEKSLGTRLTMILFGVDVRFMDSIIGN
jgi:hypothetical protein